MVQEKVQEILLDQLIPDEDNRPFGGFDEGKLKELAESIKAAGVIEPALVRPFHDDGSDSSSEPVFQIVAGERRWRASKIAGVPTLPCIVRELDDITVLKLRGIENLQREDLHPLDEANWYQRLRSVGGYSVESLANEVGKSASHIYQTLKLLELEPEGQKQLAEGTITAGHAILVARLQPEDQKEVLKRVAEENQSRSQYHEPPMSVNELETDIHRDYFRELDRATFKMNDGDLLPEAGPCTSCIKRTGAQPGLFADVSKKDCCLDPTCFNAKLDALVKRHEARLEGADYLRVQEGYDGNKSRPAGVLQPYQWEECKKKDPGAKQVLIVTGAGRGRLTWGKKDRATSSSGGPSAKEQERWRKEEAKRKEQWAVTQLTERLLYQRIMAAAEKARTKSKRVYSTLLRSAALAFYEGWLDICDTNEDLQIFWGEVLNEKQARERVGKLSDEECMTFFLRLAFFQDGRYGSGNKEGLPAVAKLLSLAMFHITPLGVPIVTWEGIRVLGAFCLVMGIVGSLVVPLFLHLLDSTPRERARRAKAMPAEAQARIGKLSDRVLQLQERAEALQKENAELRRLNAERHQFNRYHDARVHAAQGGKPQ